MKGNHNKMMNNNNESFSYYNTNHIGICSNSRSTCLSHSMGSESGVDRWCNVFWNIRDSGSSILQHSVFKLFSSSPNVIDGDMNSNEIFFQLESLDMNYSKKNRNNVDLPLVDKVKIFGRNSFFEIFRLSILTQQYMETEKLIDGSSKVQNGISNSMGSSFLEHNPLVQGYSNMKNDILLNNNYSSFEHFHFLRKIYDPQNLFKIEKGLFILFENEIILLSTRKIWSRWVFNSFIRPLLRSNVFKNNSFDIFSSRKQKLLDEDDDDEDEEEEEEEEGKDENSETYDVSLDEFESSNVIITVPDGLKSKEMNEIFFEIQNFCGKNVTNRIPTPSPVLNKEQFVEPGSHIDFSTSIDPVPHFFVNVVSESQIIASIIQSRPMFIETNYEIARSHKMRRRDFGKTSSDFGCEFHLIFFLRDSYLSYTIYKKKKSVLFPKNKVISKSVFSMDNSSNSNSFEKDQKVFDFFRKMQTKEMITVRSTRKDDLGNKAIDYSILLSIFRDGIGIPKEFNITWNSSAIHKFQDISMTLNWGKEEIFFNLEQVRNLRRLFFKAQEMFEEENDDDSSKDEEEEEDGEGEGNGIPNQTIKLMLSYDEMHSPNYMNISMKYKEFSEILKSHREKVIDVVSNEIQFAQSISKEKKKFIFLHLVTEIEFLDRGMIIELVEKFEDDLYGWEDDTRYVSIFDSSLLSQRATTQFGSHKSGLVKFQKDILKLNKLKMEKEKEKEITESNGGKKLENSNNTSSMKIIDEEIELFHELKKNKSNQVDDEMRFYYDQLPYLISSPIWLIDRQKIRFGCRFQALSSLNPRFIEVELHDIFRFSTKETKIEIVMDEEEEDCPIEIWQAVLCHPQKEYHPMNNYWIWLPIHVLLLSSNWIESSSKSSFPSISTKVVDMDMSGSPNMSDINNDENREGNFFEVGLTHLVNGVLSIRLTSKKDITKSKNYHIKPIQPDEEWKKNFTKIDPRNQQVNYLKCKNQVFFLGSSNYDGGGLKNGIDYSTIQKGEYLIEPLNKEISELYNLDKVCNSWNLFHLKNNNKIIEQSNEQNGSFVGGSPFHSSKEDQQKMTDEVEEEFVFSMDESISPNLSPQKVKIMEDEDEEEEEEEEEEFESEEEEEEEEEEEDRFFFTSSMFARKRKFVDTRSLGKVFTIGDYRKRRKKQIEGINNSIDSVLEDFGNIHPLVKPSNNNNNNNNNGSSKETKKRKKYIAKRRVEKEDVMDFF